MNVDFSNIELIPKILDEMLTLKDELNDIKSFVLKKYDLTKLKDVSLYLGVSRRTIYNYIDDGRFKLNIHYTKSIKDKHIKITFVESAIINFKG